MHPESEQPVRSNTVTIPVSLFDAMARKYYASLVGTGLRSDELPPNASSEEPVQVYKPERDAEGFRSLIATMSPVGPGFEPRGRLVQPKPAKSANPSGKEAHDS